MHDLFAMASQNASAVQSKFEELVNTLSDDGKAKDLRDFAAWIQKEASISINTPLFVVVDIVRGGRYQNIHEWANDQESLSGRPKEQILRERLGKWFERRVTFDRSFLRGEEFRYGALNTNGLGLPGWHRYCLVLHQEFQKALKKAVCISGDSLEICFSVGCSFDVQALEKNVSLFNHRQQLVAIKRADNVHGALKDNWHELLIRSSKDYFEVVFIGDVSLDSVAVVRMSKSEDERLKNLAFANFGRKLDEAERHLVNDYVRLRSAVREKKIILEVIL